MLELLPKRYSYIFSAKSIISFMLYNNFGGTILVKNQYKLLLQLFKHLRLCSTVHWLV
jgi:hypothetical protein